MNKSILVIGGAGYIGSHVTLELCDLGYDVTVFDNLSTGHLENIDQRAEFIEGDILNYLDLDRVFSNPFRILMVMIREAIPIANPITDNRLANEVKLLEVGDRKWR